MTVEPTKHCPNCGAAMKAYWHVLTPGLVGNLVKMVRRVKEKGINEVQIVRELQLTHTQYNNFQKLRYHALIAKVKDPAGAHKSGFWLLTDRAGQFLRGELSVPRRVQTFRNKVLAHDPATVHIRQLRHQLNWFESEIDFAIYEGKLHYAQQKQLQLV